MQSFASSLCSELSTGTRQVGGGGRLDNVPRLIGVWCLDQQTNNRSGEPFALAQLIPLCSG